MVKDYLLPNLTSLIPRIVYWISFLMISTRVKKYTINDTDLGLDILLSFVSISYLLSNG